MLRKYGALDALSAFIVIGGIVCFVIGAILLFVGLNDLLTTPPQAFGMNAAPGLLKLFASVTFLVWGLMLCAVGQLIKVFIDIALQTAPIAQLAENSAKTVAFFERLSGRTTTATEESELTYKEDVYEGYKWRQYSDGHVEAYIAGAWKRFKDSTEFGQYATSPNRLRKR